MMGVLPFYRSCGTIEYDQKGEQYDRQAKVI